MTITIDNKLLDTIYNEVIKDLRLSNKESGDHEDYITDEDKEKIFSKTLDHFKSEEQKHEFVKNLSLVAAKDKEDKKLKKIDTTVVPIVSGVITGGGTAFYNWWKMSTILKAATLTMSNAFIAGIITFIINEKAQIANKAYYYWYDKPLTECKEFDEYLACDLGQFMAKKILEHVTNIRHALENELEPDASLVDTITLDLYSDPVFAADGNTYSRESLLTYYTMRIQSLKDKHGNNYNPHIHYPVCPKNPGAELTDPTNMIRNHMANRQVEEFKDKLNLERQKLKPYRDRIEQRYGSGVSFAQIEKKRRMAQDVIIQIS